MPLHRRQHVNQRQFDLLVQFFKAVLRDLRAQRVRQLQRHVRVFGGVFRHALHRHHVNRRLVRALADHLFKRDGAVMQKFFRKMIHAVTVARRVQHVRRDHRVEGHALDLDAVMPQDEHVIFDVLPEFRQRLVFEQRLERAKRGVKRELRRRAEIAVRDRNIRAGVRLRRDRNPHQFGQHRMFARRLRIHREAAGLPQFRDKFGQLRFRLNRAVRFGERFRALFARV